MSNWQNIDTAPRDGTIVLVADVFGVVAAAFDGPPAREWYEDVIGEKISDDEFQGVCDEHSHAWVSVNPISGDQEYLTPSHWMPLPSAPADAAGGIREGHST